jgi:hypothetical protein
MGIKMRRLTGRVWIGFIWLIMGTGGGLW